MMTMMVMIKENVLVLYNIRVSTDTDLSITFTSILSCVIFSIPFSIQNDSVSLISDQMLPTVNHMMIS